MPHVVGDRIEDTTTSPGAGNLTVSGVPPTGKKTVSAYATADGDTIDLVVAHATLDEWVYARFTRVSANVYTQAATPFSSSSGSAINFSAGTKEVFSDVGAFFARHLNTVEIAIASVAGTTNLGALKCKYVEITGTNTMTGFGTEIHQERFVRYAAATPHTHNATSFICPTGASFTSAAGDTAHWKSDASGNWRCHDYFAAAVSPIAASATIKGPVELATDAEAQGIADTGRAVTPANLAAMVATQANQETGTANDRFVTSGRQHFHPSAAKAWGKCTQTGTMTLNASYGVSSITDSGVGTTTWNLSVTFSSTHYATVLGLNNVAGAYDHTVAASWTATTFIQYHLNNANTAQDGIIFMAAFGDL